MNTKNHYETARHKSRPRTGFYHVNTSTQHRVTMRIRAHRTQHTNGAASRERKTSDRWKRLVRGAAKLSCSRRHTAQSGGNSSFGSQSPNQVWNFRKVSKLDFTISRQKCNSMGETEMHYHITTTPNITKLEPRKPPTAGMEEPSVPRVCAAPTVRQCLAAFPDFENVMYYLYAITQSPDVDNQQVLSLGDDWLYVWDAEETGEVWYTSPVECTCIAKFDPYDPPVRL